MEYKTNSRQLQFGDLIYIEINDLEPPANTMKGLLCSNSFLDPGLYAVKSKTPYKSNFMNCVFRVLPGLIDNHDEIELVQNLEEELQLYNRKDSVLSKVMTASIKKKRDLLEFKEKSTRRVNLKIINEMTGKPVKYGELIALEHYMSNSYLRTHNTAHQEDNSLLNLTLSTICSQECYFKIMPTVNGSSSEIVEYEVEINIMSFLHGTCFSVGSEKIDFTSDNLDSSIENDNLFPYDSYRRPSPVESFPDIKFPVGFRFEKIPKHYIRLYPYCRYEDHINMTKGKIIKNGDFIRITDGDFYLTGSKSPYKSSLTFNQQKIETYPMHQINTLFEVIFIDKKSNLASYPLGEEIQANSKKLDNPDDIFTVYLRHFPTGEYLTLDGLVKFNSKSNDDQNDISSSNTNTHVYVNKDDIPCAQFIHSNVSTDENQALIKNSAIFIKLLAKDKSKESSYMTIKNIESHNMNKYDKKTLYFCGHNDTENHIKDSIRLIKKTIIMTSIANTSFRIAAPISKDDIIDMLLCESYANQIRHFMSIFLRFKNLKNNEKRPSNKEFNTAMLKMFGTSTTFLETLIKGITTHTRTSNNSKTNTISQTNSFTSNFDNPKSALSSWSYHDIIADPNKQIFLREFKIFDMINRLIYYFVVDNNVKSANANGVVINNQDDDLDINSICKLIDVYIQIILIGVKDNHINYRYNSQYIGIYINGLINTKGYIAQDEMTHQNIIKSSLVKLLSYVLLNDDNLDSLSLLYDYEKEIFKNLEEQTNFQQNLVILINLICNIKSPNFKNIISDNLITNFLTNKFRRDCILPVITPNMDININRKGPVNNNLVTYKVIIGNDTDEATKYVLCILELLKTLSYKRSYLFGQIISQMYSNQLYEKLMEPDILINSKFKETLTTLIKNVNELYTYLPIKEIPQKIQFMFKGYQDYERKTSEIIVQTKEWLINHIETNIIQKSNITSSMKNFQLTRKTNINLDNDFDFKEPSEKDEKVDKHKEIVLNYLNIVYRFLKENKHIDSKVLLHIHEGMCKLLIWLMKPDLNADTNKETVIDKNQEIGHDKSRVEPDKSRVEPDRSHVEPDKSHVEHDKSHVEPDKSHVEPDKSHVEPDDNPESHKKNMNNNSKVNILMECNEKIFKIIDLIDDHMVNIAMSMCIRDMRNHIISPEFHTNNSFMYTERDKLLNTSIHKDPSKSHKAENIDEILQEDLNEIINEKWRTKENLYELGRPGTHIVVLHSEHKRNPHRVSKEKKKMNENPPFFENKLINILGNLITKGNTKHISLTIETLKRKTKYEKRIFNKIKTCALLNNSLDGDEFLMIVESLLGIYKIYKRLKIIADLNQPKINNKDEGIANALKGYFENIICILYDYDNHIKGYPDTIRNSRELFLSRLESSKSDYINEIPFVIKPEFVKQRFQKIMKILNCEEILMPFLGIFQRCNEYFVKVENEFILVFRYLSIIISLYLHNNKENQLSISKQHEFIIMYYQSDILKKSVETTNMLIEMAKGNKILSKLHNSYLIEIITNNYIEYIKQVSMVNQPNIVNSTALINYIRGLPILFQLNIPSDIFDINKIMIDKFYDFLRFLNTDTCMVFEKMLNDKHDPAILTMKRYKVPILYLIWKEFLQAQAEFTKIVPKLTIIPLQEKLPISTFLTLLTHISFEFHFELKSLILNWFNTLYYTTHIKSNAFDLIEEWDTFIGYLLLDISAYIHYQDLNWNLLIDPESNVFQRLPMVTDRVKKYDILLQKYDLNKVILYEYQCDVQYMVEWEKYIYETILDVLLNLFVHEKERILDLEDKYKSKKSLLGINNIFDYWILLLRKLLDITKNKKFLEKSLHLIKTLALINEYNSYKDILNDIRLIIENPPKNQGINCEIGDISIQYSHEPNSDNIVLSKAGVDCASVIEKYVNKQAEKGHINRERNMKYIARSIEHNRLCIGKLIQYISQQTHDIIESDRIYVLRLLRNIIEIQNDDPAYEDKAIYEWADVDNNNIQKIIYTQNILNSLHIVKAIFYLLYDNTHNVKVLNEIILLSISLVYGGNKSIQEKFYKEFMEDSENEIIYKICMILKANFENIINTNKRINNANYIIAQNYLFQRLKQENNNNNGNYSNNTGNITNNNDINTNNNNNNAFNTINFEDNKDYIAKEFYIKNQNILKLDIDIDTMTTKDNTLNQSTIIMLLFLQNLCEGHFQPFQNFLREQRIPEDGPVHPKSFNVLAFMKFGYNEILKVLNINNVQIAIKILDLLIEALQGDSFENTTLLLKKTLLTDLSQTLKSLDNDIDLLPRGFGLNDHHSEFQELKSKALILLLNLVERGTIESKEMIKRFVDLDVIVDFTASNLLKYYEDYSQTRAGLNNKIGLSPKERNSIKVQCFKKKKDYPRKETMENEDMHNNHYLKDGLTGYIILRSLWDREEFDIKLKECIDRLGKRLRNILSNGSNDRLKEKVADIDFKIISHMIYIFCPKYVLSIELTSKKTGPIKRLFFPKYIEFSYLSKDIKEDFEDHVDRSNTQSKIEEFMSKADEFISQAQLDYQSRRSLFGLNMNSLYSWIRFLCDCLAVTANLINLFTLDFTAQGDNTSTSTSSASDSSSSSSTSPDLSSSSSSSSSLTLYAMNNGDITQEKKYFLAILIITIINAVLAFKLLSLWLISKMNKYLSHRWEEDLDEALKESPDLPPNFDNIISDALNDGTLSREMAEKVLEYKQPYTPIWNMASQIARKYYLKRKFKYLAQCPTLRWHIVFLGFCIFSSFHPLVCALQLFDIVVKSDTVYRIFASVHRNWRQFLWTFMLLFTVIYIYSLIGLYYYQDYFVNSDNENIRFCIDEYSCFLANFNYGLRNGGGIGGAIKEFTYESSAKGDYFVKTIYDLSFFILNIILLLNLIFGMIIDSFGELRDEKTYNDDDRENVCFICGLDRGEIERHFSFEQHTLFEHNKWNYLAYIIYLTKKTEYAPTELSDVESHVWDRFNKKDYDWIPIGRSLTLEKIYEQEEKLKKNDLEEMQEEMMVRFDSISKSNKEVSDEIKQMRMFLLKKMYGNKAASLGMGSLPKKA